MTLWLARLACLAVTAPLLFLAGRLLPAATRRGKSPFLAVALLLGALFFLLRPHEDVLTGLDNMAYRVMAETFLEGREMVQEDAVAALPPGELGDAFMYRPGGRLRPTRDVVFQIDAEDSATRPFFEPFLPLAAAGSHMPGRFMSLLATLWFAVLLVSCYSKSSGRGAFVALCYFLATAWPAWFLRGYHAEGAAAILAASVFLSASARPFAAPLSFATAAFALALSVSIHPTALLVSAPAALALFPSAKRRPQLLAILAGGLAGILPLVLITRHVCHPYGDWTRPETILSLARAAAEHRVFLLGAAGLALAGAATLLLSFSPGARRRCALLDRKLGPAGWACLALLPPALVLALPLSPVKPVLAGLRSCWTGIGLPCALLWALGVLATVRGAALRDGAARSATSGARLLLALLCWTALAFLLIKGVERHAGLWSQRRFLPTALLLTSLFASSVADRRLAPSFLWNNRLAPVLLAGCALFNLARGPDAYGMINGQGTRRWKESLGKALADAGLVVFDYHPHSVPFASSPGNRVLGIGRHGLGEWPAIESWLSGVAETGTVTVATSWAPSEVLESKASLRAFRPNHGPTNLFSVRYPVLATKGFFPVERRTKTATVALFSLVPNARPGRLAQDKFLDGSPIGLRGPWGKTRDGATWTRQGSAVVGPVTNRGTIIVTLDASWPRHPRLPAQAMTLTPPWGEEGAVSFRVASRKEGEEPSPVVLELPAPTNAAGRTGLYRFSSPTPYDPAGDGLRGYDADLGVLLRRVRIGIRAD